MTVQDIIGWFSHSGLYIPRSWIGSDVGRHELDGDSKKRKAAFQAVFQASVSNSEQSRWLRGVDAALHVLIVDTCNSLGAVESRRSEFKPGVFGRRVLGQLSYDKALLALVDSQTDEFVVCLAGLKYGG